MADETTERLPIVRNNNQVWTEAERAVAKALIFAYGDVPKAHEHLTTIWTGEDGTPDRVPSQATLAKWRRDGNIEFDAEVMEQFTREAQFAVKGTAHRIIVAAEARLLKELADGAAKDVQAIAITWGIAVDKIMPKGGGRLEAAKAIDPTTLLPGQKFTLITTYEAAPYEQPAHRQVPSAVVNAE